MHVVLLVFHVGGARLGGVFTGASTRWLLSPAPPAAPNLLSQDRVEVVGFATRGTYLVICAVNVHFAEGMYGWVKVVL